MSEIIIALDFNDEVKTLNFAQTMIKRIRWVKLGLEQFSRSGPATVIRLKQMGFNVFVDLKLFDIPNTVSGAVAGCVDMGADMLTIHVLGGEKMAKAALEARNGAAGSKPGPLLVGVTILTSMDREDLPWSDERTQDMIVRDLACQAHGWGLDGCVCSGLEAGLIRKEVPQEFRLIIPGIRTQPSEDDQKRVVTPEQARDLGADYLVIGRPVTRSADPVQALEEIKNRLKRT